jgi:hypothetical protein
VPFRVERIVSLGAWCQTTHQIRRMFGASVSSPYDWLVTPLDALIASLRDGGQQFGRAVVTRDNEYAICYRYGLLYHHEFGRDALGIPIVSEAALANCRQKLTHKFSAMVADCAHRNTLFVRYGGFARAARPSPYVVEEEIIGSQHINPLVSALDAAFPTTNFRLLFFTNQSFAQSSFDATLDRRVITAEMPPDPPNAPWEGTDQLWEDLFRGTGLEFAQMQGDSELTGSASR